MSTAIKEELDSGGDEYEKDALGKDHSGKNGSEGNLTTEDFLEMILNRKADSLKKTFLNKISEKNLTLKDFSDRDGQEVTPLVFPAENAGRCREYKLWDVNVALDALVCHNDINRPITPQNVYALTLDYITGNYEEENPDTIMFSKNKKMINGQHRLCAIIVGSIIVPNLKIEFPIEFNKKESLMAKIDSGKRRTSGDKAVIALRSRGVVFERSKYSGSTVTALMTLVNAVFGGTTGASSASDEEKIDFFEEHRDLINDYFKLFKGVYRKGKGIRYNASWAAAFVKASLDDYYGIEVIKPLATKFANNLFANPKHPLRKLYEKFEDVKIGKLKLSPSERYGLTVKAIRRALLEEDALSLRATKVDFTEKEARDYHLRGKDSPALKSVARKN